MLCPRDRPGPFLLHFQSPCVFYFSLLFSSLHSSCPLILSCFHFLTCHSFRLSLQDPLALDLPRHFPLLCPSSLPPPNLLHSCLRSRSWSRNSSLFTVSLTQRSRKGLGPIHTHILGLWPLLSLPSFPPLPDLSIPTPMRVTNRSTCKTTCLRCCPVIRHCLD